MKYTAGTVIDTIIAMIAIMTNTKYKIQSISENKRVFYNIKCTVKNQVCVLKNEIVRLQKTQPNTQVRAVAFFYDFYAIEILFPIYLIEKLC